MAGAAGQTMELLRFAEALAARGENKLALVVDLAGIPEANDRIFFRSLVRFVEERTADVPHDALPLARHFIALLASPEHAAEIERRLTALSDYLGEQRHGTVRVQVFDLSKDAKLFVNTCRRLLQQPPPPPSDRSLRIKDPPPPDMLQLDRFLQVQRVLRNADISMLMRNQDIWVLRPDMAPIRMAREIWISVPTLERRMEIPLAGQPWLFGRITELADHRLIVQLLNHDGADNALPICINLHLATVFSADFRRLSHQPTMDTPRNLIVELPYAERRENPQLFAMAVKELRQHNFSVTLDGLTPGDLSTLTMDDLDLVDWIKLDVGKVPADTANLSGQIARIGPNRIILHHCDTDAPLRFGLPEGIHRYQGRAIGPILEEPEQVEALLGRAAAENAAQSLKGAKGKQPRALAGRRENPGAAR